jgi:hypothetical protein
MDARAGVEHGGEIEIVGMRISAATLPGAQMGDPFRLFGRLFLALFRIMGYFIAFMAHAGWCIAHGHPEHAGDAIGDFGRSVTDVIADLFRD